MEYLIIFLVALLILFGFVGIIVPALPGIGLIFSGIIAYALYFGIETIGLATLIALAVVTAFSMMLEYLATAYGATRFGSTKWGILGSVIGGLAGMALLNIPGLILGVFFGAGMGEIFVAKKGTKESVRAGWGSLLGFLGGTVIKLVLGIVMVGVFLAKVWR